MLGDGSVVYRLGWWYQVQVVPDLMDLESVAPDDWRLVSIITQGVETCVPLLGAAGDTPLTVERGSCATVISSNTGSSSDVDVVLRRTE